MLLISTKRTKCFLMQNGDAPETQKKVHFCFRVMSRFFSDPAKAEENFQILDQLKDSNIWKILASLLDPNYSCHQFPVCQVGSKDLVGLILQRVSSKGTVHLGHSLVYLGICFIMTGYYAYY